MQVLERVSRAVRGNWILFAVVALLVPLCTTVYMRTVPNTYTASALVALGPKVERPVSAQVVFLTAPRYVAYATAPAIVERIAPPLKINATELLNALSVTMEATTANLHIAVTLTDRLKATAAASALADAVLLRAEEDTILSAELLSAAEVPTAASGPPRMGIVTASVAGGLLIAACLALGVDVVRRRRKISRHDSRDVPEQQRRRDQPDKSPRASRLAHRN